MSLNAFAKCALSGAAVPVIPFILLAWNVAWAQCTNVSYEVTKETQWMRGPGHCDSKLGVVLSNRSSNRVVCKLTIGTKKRRETYAVKLRPGESRGGERGGLWNCDATGETSHVCLASRDAKQDAECELLLWR